MAKGKQKRRPQQPPAPADLQARSPSAETSPRRKIRPHPPKKNWGLLALAIVLFLIWLAYLIIVAVLAARDGAF